MAFIKWHSMLASGGCLNTKEFVNVFTKINDLFGWSKIVDMIERGSGFKGSSNK